MKLRMLFMAVAVVLLISRTWADDKGDCSAKTASSKKSSCCMAGAKASLTSNVKSSNNIDATARVIPINNPNTDGKEAKECTHGSAECNMKTAKMSGDCTAAEKANCDMSKSKVAMKNTKGTMGCCKGKNAEAKNTNSKSKQNKSTADVKGTN